MTSRREQAGLPLYDELRCTTLEAMRSMASPASNDDIDDAVSAALGLSNSQRQIMATNGRQTELAYRVAWARSGLKAVGAVDSVGRALWRVTEVGQSLSCDEVARRHKEYATALRVKPDVPDGISNGEPTASGGADDDPEATGDTPWKEELLHRLGEMTPSAFEHLAASILRAAGFDEVEVTGRSGDGGIDGIGVYRPLGLISFQTAFQCKRYQGSVGAGAVRDFRGSFIGRSDRGLIVTTSTFTKAARQESARAGANQVDLIDGDALCDLLRDFQIGVKTRTIEVTEVDPTYFDQFEQDNP